MIYTKRILTMYKKCILCNSLIKKPYKMTINNWEKRKFCSQKCNGLSKKGKDVGFKKGNTPWNKNKKCDYLLGNSNALGYKHTEEEREKMSIKKKNEKHPGWKGNKASYSAIHKWLIKNYGRANKCENINCLKISSKRYEYALLANKSYDHNRNFYKTLCVPCHRSYDSRLNKLNVQL